MGDSSFELRLEDDLNVADLTRVEIRPGVFVRYDLVGPEDGDLIVLLCGLSVDSSIFRPLQRVLSLNGLRVLTFDYVMRGYSSAEAGGAIPKCDGMYFVDMLMSVLNKLDLIKPLTLVGFSMGGAVAHLFVKKHPELITRLVLIASAGLSFPMGVGAGITKMPGVGWPIFKVMAPGHMRKAMPVGNTFLPGMFDFQCKHTPNYLRGVHSTVTHFEMTALEPVIRDVAKNLSSRDIPVLIIWGNKDIMVPFTACKGPMVDIHRQAGSSEAIPDREAERVSVEVVEGGEHDVVATHAGEVAHIVSKWIDSH